MKIVHISDLHYGELYQSVEKLIEKIIKTYSSDDVKPLVVITGDLVDKPKKDLMYRCKQILLQLKDEGFETLICHGNHDIKGTHGSILKRKALSHFNYYFRNFLPENNLNGSEENDFFSYPLVHQFGHYYFIGMDSNEIVTFGNARGGFSKDQVEEAVEMVDEIKKKDSEAVIVAYFHHNPFKYSINLPLWFDYDQMKLENRAQFLQAINDCFDVILFGHYHQNISYEREAEQLGVKLALLGARSAFDNDFPFYEIDLSHFTYQIK